MLETRGISVRYDGPLVVDRIDMGVRGGETLALLGRSGSGKTTLLRAIAGLTPLAAGSVWLDGQDLAEVPTHERSIGLVFQDFALFPHLDVAANVGYGLKPAGVADINASVTAALETVGLDGMERRRTDQLSGGQAQRVALARTLATQPKVLLLDEPLGSLDPAYRRRVAGELSQLLRAAAIPTVIVTHDTGEAFALGDRIMVLDAGRAVVTGTPDAVWNNPGSAEAARILGHTGVIEVRSANNSVTADGIPIPATVPAGTATVLIRRGHIVAEGGLELVVAYSRFRGPGWVTGLRLGSAVVEVETAGRLAESSTVRVEIDPKDVVAL